MRMPIFLALIVTAIAATAADAATCYKTVGDACVQSSTGSLSSSCSSDCAVGWKRINGKTKLACLS
jgi:hypothetical protein